MIAPACLVLALLAQAPAPPATPAAAPSAAQSATSAAASPAAGAWRVAYKTSDGRTQNYVLAIEVKDGAITGTVSSPRGSVPITSGKVDGRNITFTVVRRAAYDEIALVYQGTIDRDTMRLTMKAGARPPIALTARRDASATPAAPTGSGPR